MRQNKYDILAKHLLEKGNVRIIVKDGDRKEVHYLEPKSRQSRYYKDGKEYWYIYKEYNNDEHFDQCLKQLSLKDFKIYGEH